MFGEFEEKQGGIVANVGEQWGESSSRRGQRDEENEQNLGGL